MTLNAKSMYIVNEDMIIVVVLAKNEKTSGEALQIFVESCSSPEFFGGWEELERGGWLVSFFTILFCLFV